MLVGHLQLSQMQRYQFLHAVRHGLLPARGGRGRRRHHLYGLRRKMSGLLRYQHQLHLMRAWVLLQQQRLFALQLQLPRVLSHGLSRLRPRLLHHHDHLYGLHPTLRQLLLFCHFLLVLHHGLLPEWDFLSALRQQLLAVQVGHQLHRLQRWVLPHRNRYLSILRPAVRGMPAVPIGRLFVLRPDQVPGQRYFVHGLQYCYAGVPVLLKFDGLHGLRGRLLPQWNHRSGRLHQMRG